MIPLISVVGFIIIIVIIIIVFAILLLFQLSFISSWTRTCSKWCFVIKYIHVYDHWGCGNNSVYILSDFQSYIVSKLKKVRSLIFLKKNDKNNIELWILIWLCSVFLSVFKDLSTPIRIRLSHSKSYYLHFTDCIYSSFTPPPKKGSWSVLIRKNFLHFPAPRNYKTNYLYSSISKGVCTGKIKIYIISCLQFHKSTQANRRDPLVYLNLEHLCVCVCVHTHIYLFLIG